MVVVRGGKRSFQFAFSVAAALGLATWGASPSAFALSLGGPAHETGTGTTGGDHEPTHYIPVPSERSFASRYNDRGVLNYGQAGFVGSPTTINMPAPVVGMASTHDGKGYWLVAADGAVFAYGDAGYWGGMQHKGLHGPVVGIAATPDGGGYWLVSLDGGVFSFGDAHFYGSAGGMHLGSPVVGMAADPKGGYWLAAEGGGVFSFGGAPFYGSMAGKGAAPMAGIAATPSGHGYLLASGNAGVFAYGDAPFKGTPAKTYTAWITSVAVDSSDGGYWLAGADGRVYPEGNATGYGDAYNGSASAAFPVAQIVATPTSNGYWLLEPDAFPTVFSDPATTSNIVNIASDQIQADPDSGYFCNPYGPCEAWCALFATWVWRTDGVGIPSYAFVGYIYDWAQNHTGVLAPSSTPSPGDAVLYGTGPQNVNTAVHTGIVAQVWPDGAVDTIEGDAGPASTGYLSVVMNGPFLPSDSNNYNGFPIFGYALP